jgi:hypothetical protein
VLTVPVIVQEYCRTLSQRLLSKKPSEINFDSEKEVLERLKILLGEDACANADVMLRDFETSVRWCRQTKPRLPESATTTFVSATCWPTAVSDGPVAKLRLHPQLADVAAKVAETFHAWKQNQSLIMLPHHGFVEISVSQKQQQSNSNNKNEDDDQAAAAAAAETAAPAALMVRRKFRLNLVAASVVLYLREEQPRTLKGLCDLLHITPAELAQHLQDYSPQLFQLVSGGNSGEPRIQLQTIAIGDHALDDARDGGEDGADALRRQAGSAPALPAGLTQSAVDMMEQMLRTMISNLGPRTQAQVEQSMRMLGQFQGTSAEFRSVLEYFVTRNVICSDGSGTFKLV